MIMQQFLMVEKSMMLKELGNTVVTAHPRMYHIIHIKSVLCSIFKISTCSCQQHFFVCVLHVSLCFRPVFSDGNQLFIQFLSDLSLTADGFIGHYKFRPKKFPSTTVPPTTTAPPTTTRPIREYTHKTCCGGQFSLIILNAAVTLMLAYITGVALGLKVNGYSLNIPIETSNSAPPT